MLTAITDTEYKYLVHWIGTSAELHQRTLMAILKEASPARYRDTISALTGPPRNMPGSTFPYSLSSGLPR
jgi:hypothetical protein